MNAFAYRQGLLQAEGVAVTELAERYGTPLYVYSRAQLQTQLADLTSAFAAAKPLICYSVKTNSNGAVIKTFAEAGAGADVVSGGELWRARRAGVPADRIVFAGVGKTTDEIEYALKENIRFFTVESEPELTRISDVARRLGTIGRVALRVNPDVDPQTHKYISTGKKENKFGLDFARAEQACEIAARLPNLEVTGLHMHIGSQILTPQPFVEAARKVVPLCAALKRVHPAFRCLDIGGGIGIQYKPEQYLLEPAMVAREVVPLLQPLGLEIVMEPGRYLVGNAGILVARVQYVKDNPFKKFIVVDAAMNDLIRPSLYQAHHEIRAVRETAAHVQGDVVGPICESGDFLAQDRELPAVRQGDLLAVLSAGAYGFAMSSNYNSRPRAAEVMVSGNEHRLIRRRETWDDLVAQEIS
jgi:diaminopimelate decarboxylase